MMKLLKLLTRFEPQTNRLPVKSGGVVYDGAFAAAKCQLPIPLRGHREPPASRRATGPSGPPFAA